MTIPHDDIIKYSLLKLLDNALNGTMHCNDVYKELAKEFPMLTHSELNDPYRSSLSHWANRVQWAREHLAKQGYILRPRNGAMRSYWSITESGQRALHDPIDVPGL
jgi:restriction endonuclease Mrr